MAEGKTEEQRAYDRANPPPPTTAVLSVRISARKRLDFFNRVPSEKRTAFIEARITDWLAANFTTPEV